MTIDELKNIKIGTKVKYMDTLFNKIKPGYFAGLLGDTGTAMISQINYNDDFTGIKMIDLNVCRFIEVEYIELY